MYYMYGCTIIITTSVSEWVSEWRLAAATLSGRGALTSVGDVLADGRKAELQTVNI